MFFGLLPAAPLLRDDGGRGGVVVAVGVLVAVDLAFLAALLDLVVPVEEGQCGAAKGDGVALGALAAGRRQVP